MDRKNRRGRTVLVLLLLSSLLAISDASFLSRLRQLATVAPPPSVHVTASPSPDPSQNPRVSAAATSNNSGSGSGKTPSDIKPYQPGPSPSQPATTQDDETNKKGPGGSAIQVVEAGPNENCSLAAPVCNESSIVACFLNPRPGSKEMVILVENNGETSLKVNLISSNLDDGSTFGIGKHQKNKVILGAGSGSKMIVRIVRTETAVCEVPTDPFVSPGNHFFRLPSTDKLITPVNGAYFLILTGIVFGGGCACFMLRRKGRQDGIPYQELEMSMPESSSINNIVDNAEGWDQDWDDDWDEESAVKTPGARHAASISANGLTSRSGNKDPWESTWDD